MIVNFSSSGPTEMYRISISSLTSIDLQLNAAFLLNFFVDLSDEWLPIVRGNNIMGSYVDFGAFTGKTGRTTSYKNPLADLF